MAVAIASHPVQYLAPPIQLTKPITAEALTIATTRKTQEVISTSIRQSLDELPKAVIDGARVSLMKYEELQKLKVCICNVPELQGMGTPNDPRLGTLEEGQLCYTCKQGPMTCPGHLGMIELNRWFLHPKFAEHAVRVLMAVCNSCGHILTSSKVLKRMGILDLPILARLKAISLVTSKIGKCMCNPVDAAGIVRPCIPNPIYFPSKCKDTYTVMCEYANPMAKGKKISNERTIEEIFEIFNRIDEYSLTAMGFTGKTHPRDFVLRGLPIIPPCAIPYVVREGEVSHDYITTSYCDIIRYNNIVTQKAKDTSDGAEVERRKAIRNLYFYIYHMMDNTDGRYTRSRDEPILSIIERMVEKNGLIRGYSMGKRVDFSGRSVLGPYNKLQFGYIAFPQRMRYIHTTPHRVNAFNLEIFREMYARDQIVSIEKATKGITGCRFRITPQTKARYQPEIGDEVERIGMTGDEVLFNRQPTLDKLSIMGYRAYYVNDPQYDCFGLHSSYTTPHNADFDGDEGNKHKIQSLDARAEIRHIAAVENCIMNAKGNKPTMGLVYNCTTAGYLMTQPGVTVTPAQFAAACQLLQDRSHLATLITRLDRHGIPHFSGHALFSILLPDDTYYVEKGVEIRDGVLVRGVLTSAHLGTTENSIIHRLWKQYGQHRTARFFTEGQWLLDWFLENYGFSVGYSACITANQRQVDAIIEAEVSDAKIRIEALGRSVGHGLEAEVHERKVISYLNAISRIGNRISLETLTADNPLNVMCRSGAKGKETNIAQIVGCLGQQYIMGV
jgi:DNA-directed RNA polymerase II subunit RPB1